MPAPTPNPFEMVEQVLLFSDGSPCSLHVTVSRAMPIDAYDYSGETRYKQFLLVEDGAGNKVGVRWFDPKYDLRAGDVVQMYSGAKHDKAKCTIATDTGGKRIMKVSGLAMLLCDADERPAVFPEAAPPATEAAPPATEAAPPATEAAPPATEGQQQPAGGGAPPNYNQPAQGGQQRPAAANGGPAPVTRQRYDHEQILALQAAVFTDRLSMVKGLCSDSTGGPLIEQMDTAARLTAAIVIPVVDGKIDLVLPANGSTGEASGPPVDYQAPGEEVDSDEIPF